MHSGFQEFWGTQSIAYLHQGKSNKRKSSACKNEVLHVNWVFRQYATPPNHSPPDQSFDLLVIRLGTHLAVKNDAAAHKRRLNGPVSVT